MHALYLFDAMISGVDTRRLKIKDNDSDKELIEKLIEKEISGGGSGIMEFDDYLQREWMLFLETKTEIYLNFFDMRNYFNVLPELVMFKVVRNDKKAVIGNDNILRPKWISIFPGLDTVRINTDGVTYKFRMEALLETMESAKHSLTWIVEDGYWVKRALTNEVRAAFNEKEWNIDSKKYGEWVFKQKEQ